MIVPYSKQTVLRQRIWVLQLSRSRTRSEGLWAVDNCTNTGKQKLRSNGTERRLKLKTPVGEKSAIGQMEFRAGPRDQKPKSCSTLSKKLKICDSLDGILAKTAKMVPGTSAVKKSHRKFLAKFQFFLDVIFFGQLYLIMLSQNDGHRKIYILMDNSDWSKPSLHQNIYFLAKFGLNARSMTCTRFTLEPGARRFVRRLNPI